jgi:hypothetical protein
MWEKIGNFYPTLILLIYSQGFKVIKEFFQDKNNPRCCWSFIKLDEKHFETTQKAGWFLHPCITRTVILLSYFLSSLSSSLQIFHLACICDSERYVGWSNSIVPWPQFWDRGGALLY